MTLTYCSTGHMHHPLSSARQARTEWRGRRPPGHRMHPRLPSLSLITLPRQTTTDVTTATSKPAHASPRPCRPLEQVGDGVTTMPRPRPRPHWPPPCPAYKRTPTSTHRLTPLISTSQTSSLRLLLPLSSSLATACRFQPGHLPFPTNQSASRRYASPRRQRSAA
jgi:hypothetical protein